MRIYRILVVEDEDGVRADLVDNMPWASMGYKVVGQVPNGRDALNFVLKNDVDVVLSDIIMPIMDGLKLGEVLHELKPNIRIVLTSTFANFAFAKRAFRFNAFDCIIKPIEQSELIQCFLDLKDVMDEASHLQSEKHTIGAYGEVLWPPIPKSNEEYVPRPSKTAFSNRTGEDTEPMPKNRMGSGGTESPEGGIKDAQESLARMVFNGMDFIIQNRDRDYSPNMAAQIRNYIDENFAEDISLTDLSTQFNLSPSYISTLFKDTYGISYSNYLKQARLHRAKQLIENNPDMKIREVCSRCGYKEYKYFAMKFKEEFGISPTEFRR